MQSGPIDSGRPQRLTSTRTSFQAKGLLMSHSVRRLWTGAIVLSMGCQSIPSTMTNPFAAAPVQSSIDTDDRLPPASSPRHQTAGESALATNWTGGSIKPVDSNAIEWSALSTPEDAVCAPAAGARHTGQVFRAQEGAEQESAILTGLDDGTGAGVVDDAGATSDRSLFQGFRDRLLRRESPAESSDVDAARPAVPASLLESEPAETRDNDTSPIRLVGHDEPSPGPRSSFPLRRRGHPLEAPTPYSAIARESAAESAADRNPHPDAAAETRLEESPSQDGFVSSLFDVFGIGGDRAGQTNADPSGPVRRASISPMQRPSVAIQAEQSSPSIDALRKSLQTVHWQEELDRLTALLETQLAHQTPGDSSIEQDYYVRQHVALRLLYLIGSRRPEALQAIPDCDPSQQEFWTELLWALSNVFDDEAMPDQADRARETAARLRAALTHIAPRAGLTMRHTLFCRQIDGFGSYLTFERDVFSPGQSVLVYTEVENFVSEPNPDGEFLTRLQSTLRIHQGNVTGPIVFEETLPATEDRCRSRRTDYFHSYRIALPANLTTGPHVLTLTVRDQISQKIGTAFLSFVVP